MHDAQELYLTGSACSALKVRFLLLGCQLGSSSKLAAKAGLCLVAAQVASWRPDQPYSKKAVQAGDACNSISDCTPLSSTNISGMGVLLACQTCAGLRKQWAHSRDCTALQFGLMDVGNRFLVAINTVGC